MKDLLLSSDFHPMIGGAHHWLYNVYSRWPKPVIVFAGSNSKNKDVAEKEWIFDSQKHGSLSIRRIDFSVRDISIFNCFFLKMLLSVVRQLSSITENNPTTLHCLRAFPDGILALAWKALDPSNRHIVTYAHGEEILIAQSSRQLHIMTQFIYKISSLVIANSCYTKNLVTSLAPSAKITVIHPGVNLSDFVFSKATLDRQRTLYGFTSDDVVLVTVSRLEFSKNHVGVLNSIYRLRDAGLNLKYLVVGDGKEKSNLQNLVNKLNLEDIVQFTGLLSDQKRSLIIAFADIYIMPSIKHTQLVEGFGIAFMEAAAAGVPSIAGNTGGQIEAVRDGETGLIVDGMDENAIFDAILQLASNTQLRRRMGSAGQHWATSHDWSCVVHQTTEALKKAI
jgi:phosphatidylinositol alpha-1,6-mannosyltransferase